MPVFKAPKYEKGAYVQVNIIHGFINATPRWRITLIEHVFSTRVYNTELDEPMYKTSLGIFTESALRNIPKPDEEVGDGENTEPQEG
jgi:hypothetical protein